MDLDDVTIVIPFQGADSHRVQALQWVCTRLSDTYGWPILVAAQTEGPWSKARSVETVFGDVRTGTVFIHDADVWSPNLRDLVRELDRRNRPWGQPHISVRRLTAWDSRRYMTGEITAMQASTEREHTGFAGGGIVALRTELYRDCPLDPRFEGWGHEDESWARALLVGFGPRCLPKRPSPLTHLWHPPQERTSEALGSDANLALRERYVQAAIGASSRDPEPMRELVSEACHALGR